jgi:hypothetical protein
VIGISFDPSTVDAAQQPWWEAWLKRAEAATKKAVEGFEQWLENGSTDPFQFKFNSEVWKDLKDWLLENTFHQKCAYCERAISGYYGDAEHYRPKGAVKYRTGAGTLETPTCKILDPTQGRMVDRPHPGYFWLAYDWHNLLPSCVYCNSGQGKNERFDADNYIVMVSLSQADLDAIPESQRPRQSNKWPDYYYLTSAFLDAQENPLLLNPLNAPEGREPCKHLRFGVRGTITEIDGSNLGRTTIETFRLDSEKLREARQKAQEEFGNKYFDGLRKVDPLNPLRSEARVVIDEYSRGRWPFSAAALDYLPILIEAQNALRP